MKWKFWHKNKDSAQTKESRDARPRALPEKVGRYLVVKLKMEPDYVWSLKAVMRPREDGSTLRDIRIFNPAVAGHAGIVIRNYHTLDVHAEMILFEGWYDKKSDRVEIQIRKAEEATAA